VIIAPLTIALVAIAGAASGGLGATLGIGGGVLLIPFLNIALGFPLDLASGIGLMTVIATSSVVSTNVTGRRLMNLRLGMVLQIPASFGALAGGIVVARIPKEALYVMFAIVTASVALLMLSRLDRRNVILDPSVDAGKFGGRYYEEESGQEVVYRTRRVPLALAVSLAAGIVSGLLGIGGGTLQVPALNAWCGVPMRAAAATSSVMIGVTAVASAPIYYARGDVSPPLAAAAVLGVLVGSRLGIWISRRAKAKWLKALMATLLGAVAVMYMIKAL
jgi:uncharacterized membrane protein YfcA